MKIGFSRSEAQYIVYDSETDLMLTRIGIGLIEALDQDSDEIEVEVTEEDVHEFQDTLRREYIWKAERVADPIKLRHLAERLLPDYPSLNSIKFE